MCRFTGQRCGDLRKKMWGFNGQKMWGFEVKMWGFEVKMWGFKVKDVGIQWTG